MRSALVLLATIILSALLIFTVPSCKDPEAPRGVVTVIDTAKAPIAGATVKFYTAGAKGKGTYENEKMSDASGQIILDDVKLDALIYMYGYKLDGNGDSLTGKGSLKMVTDEVTEQNLMIKK